VDKRKGRHLCHAAHVEVRAELVGVGYLVLQCRFWEILQFNCQDKGEKKNPRICFICSQVTHMHNSKRLIHLCTCY